MYRFKQVLRVFIAFSALAGGHAFAHAFPDRSSPPAGAVLHVAPSSVKIWFDDELEGAFSRIRVADSAGTNVGKGRSFLNKDNSHLLELKLNPLEPGSYHVYWIAMDRDGHRTQGDYFFQIRK